LSSLGKPYGIFLGTVCLYNAGQFIFLVLYNLFLLDRGYREGFLGLIASAFTFGGIAGTLPAAALIRRFGLRGALIGGSAGTAVVSALRCLALGRTPLVAAAFLGGMAFATLAVSAPPAVAALSQPKTRAFAFSVFFATCIAVGIVAGIAGGYLPALAGSKQAALLLSCVLTALAVWPATRLRLPSPMHAEQKSYPRTPFVRRFLVAVGLWNLGTGCFNPFFNAYFARFWQLPVDRIGMIFSAGQLAEVGAILLAPLAIRGLGLVGGIASMQLATAIALACVGAAPAASAAALAYLTGMAFQWMSEPGLNTLLMNQVEAPQRSGASAMNVFIVFGCQAVAAAGAGVVITRFGYPVMLGIAATLAAGSALLFRVLLRKF
jgi:predicted MFS family arabinose efflux permease